MDCDTCPFRRAGDSRSLDVKVAGGESWLDEFPDCGPSPCDIAEDRDLLYALQRILAELAPEERAICDAVMKGLSERDAAEEMNLPRNTYTYRRSKLFCRLKNLLKEFL